jgi:hypothetical protein
MCGKKTIGISLINKNSFHIELKKVTYTGLDIHESLPKGTSITLKTIDNYEILDISADAIKAEFKRENFFEPSAIFEIEIVMEIEYRLNKMQDDDEFNKSDIENEFKKHIGQYLSPAATYASILTSALTNVSNRIPVINPPFPLLKKDEGI